MTSCGLNDGPLKAEGSYPAVICCHLTNEKMPHQETKKIEDVMPHITNEGENRFVSEIGNGTRIGYKYFAFEGETQVSVTCRGTAEGVLILSNEEKELGRIQITPSENWNEAGTVIQEKGAHALLLDFAGEGLMDIKDLMFTEKKGN